MPRVGEGRRAREGGLTAIANSPAEAQALYDLTLAVLAAETGYAGRRTGSE